MPRGDRRRLVAFAEAEFGGASGPTRIVESRRSPIGSLVGAVVEVPPGGAGYNDIGQRRVESEVEADVGTGARILMDLDGKDVVAVLEGVCGEFCREVGRLVVAADGYRRPRLVVDVAGGHVVAVDLGAVEVDHGTVVTQQLEGERPHRCGVRGRELVAEVVGDMSGVDECRLVAFVEPELRRAAGPARIVEVRFTPGGPLVAPVVEVAPRRVLGDQRGRYEHALVRREEVDGHRVRGVNHRRGGVHHGDCCGRRCGVACPVGRRERHGVFAEPKRAKGCYGDPDLIQRVGVIRHTDVVEIDRPGEIDSCGEPRFHGEVRNVDFGRCFIDATGGVKGIGVVLVVDAVVVVVAVAGVAFAVPVRVGLIFVCDVRAVVVVVRHAVAVAVQPFRQPVDVVHAAFGVDEGDVHLRAMDVDHGRSQEVMPRGHDRVPG